MRRILIGSTAFSLVAIAGYAIWAAADRASEVGPDEGSVCAAPCVETSEQVAIEKTGGKVRGNFDPAMAGVCRFACALKADYDASDLTAQPGVRNGQRTQCPVSGVVFEADSQRPRVDVGQDVYVTCCAGCAGKLQESPGRFVRL